ncbi:MAG: hypothetical protein JNL67_13150 [Planctomycetaceae bacterium]|nr:hypothetical protein [Planctomycetaceae bacterium]
MVRTVGLAWSCRLRGSQPIKEGNCGELGFPSDTARWRANSYVIAALCLSLGSGDRSMLILTVVITILATNLFLGFFIAHYLGYGPQNFQELWTGVYLRPMNAVDPEAHSRSIRPEVLDALTQAAAAGRLVAEPTKPDSKIVTSSSQPQTLADEDLVRTMVHANLALHQAALVLDRTRWVEPISPGIFPGFPEFSWSLEIGTQELAVWRQWLRQVRPNEEVAWWKNYVAQWEKAQEAWQEYQQAIVSIGRIRGAEKLYKEKATDVICEEGSCRLVPKATSKASWWQRSSAELRTLAWVHGQLEQLHQEAFDRFVTARRFMRLLHERTLGWVRQTFKPERIEYWSNNFDSRWSWTGLSAPITDANKSEGFVLVLRSQEDWVAEYSWGGVVADAVIQHRTECLGLWFQSVPSLSVDTILPLRQSIHDRADAIWISSENPESARIAAWTIADKLELARRRIDEQEIRLPCRILIQPLSSKRTAVAAIRQAMKVLDDPEHAIWNPGSDLVWSMERRGPQPVPRPDSLPFVETTLDLAQWYVHWRLGIEFSAPQVGGDSLDAEVTGRRDALAGTSHSSTNDPFSEVAGNATALPPDDDGIEW